MLATILLQASAAGQGSPWSFWIMIIAIFVIMYFFMIRPQKKRQKKIQEFRNSLEIGTRVITSGGIYGVIKNIDGATNVVTLEIAKGVNVEIDKSCIYAKDDLQQNIAQ